MTVRASDDIDGRPWKTTKAISSPGSVIPTYLTGRIQVARYRLDSSRYWYVVIDGMHRVCGFREAGLKRIPAEIYSDLKAD